jgi:hypothetical protein
VASDDRDRDTRIVTSPLLDGTFNGLPYGWVEGSRGVAAVLVILDGTGEPPSEERVAALATLALRHANESAERMRDAE